MIRIVFENAKEPEIKYGIYINDSTQPFTTQILNKEKTIETRNKNVLHNFVGQRVGIVRFGKNKKSVLVGFATISEEIIYPTEEKFNADYDRLENGKRYAHLIDTNDDEFNFSASKWGYKAGYYLTDVEKCEPWIIPPTAKRYMRRYVDISEYFDDNTAKTEGFYKTKVHTYVGYDGKECSYETDEYKPTDDSKYKRLIKKPLNTLTADEVKYIYAIETARYMQQVQQFDTIEQAIEYAMRRYDDDDIQECTDWLHTLSFPLTVYRAVYDRTELNNISGKNHDICWSTNPEIYTNEKSSFSRCNKIVKAEINQNIINVPTTIERFLSYTGKRKSRGFGEFEINLKPNFKQSDLMNLQLIDKKDLMR